MTIVERYVATATTKCSAVRMTKTRRGIVDGYGHSHYCEAPLLELRIG